MMDVIIFGIETQALGILRQISNLNFRIFLLDKDKYGVAKFSRHKKICLQTPEYYKEKELLDFFLDLSKEYKINKGIILPTDDEQVKFLSKYKNELSEKFIIYLPPWETLKTYYYKHLLNDLCENHDIPIPKSIILKSKDDLNNYKVDYPIIVKPSAKENFLRIFKKKAIECKDKSSLIKCLNSIEKAGLRIHEVIVQQIIVGNGKNQISYAGLAKNGEVKFAITANRRRQHPLDYGKASTYVEIIDEIPIISEYSKKIIKEACFNGPFEIELKRNDVDDKYYFLDFNMRFWGWHYIVENIFNLPLALISQETDRDYHVSPQKYDSNTWMNFITDISVVPKLIINKELSLKSYLKNLIKSKQAIFSFNDPLPFIMQIILVPYLFIKRGN